MALELAKVNLWLEAVEPGKPLSFLDHHLVCGNALLGATPDLLADGIPDDAFKALTGDDKTTVTALRRQNKRERAGQGSLFSFDLKTVAEPLVYQARAIDALSDDTLDAIEAKARSWQDLISSDAYCNAVFAADLWCAAFVAPRLHDAPAITHAIYEGAQAKPDRIDNGTRATVQLLASEYGFLHWHLAFPDVFGADSGGGFDLVLGNPPWEKIQFTDREFFASRAPKIAEAAGVKRKKLIAGLDSDDPALWSAYQIAVRQAEGESHLIRATGRYPLCGLGKVNTYAIFAETMRNALKPNGRMGIIVPTGIATDDTTKHFFADCIDNRHLVSLYSFENEEKIFVSVHNEFKFCLLTLTRVILFRGIRVCVPSSQRRAARRQ